MKTISKYSVSFSIEGLLQLSWFKLTGKATKSSFHYWVPKRTQKFVFWRTPSYQKARGPVHDVSGNTYKKLRKRKPYKVPLLVYTYSMLSRKACMCQIVQRRCATNDCMDFFNCSSVTDFPIKVQTSVHEEERMSKTLGGGKWGLWDDHISHDICWWSVKLKFSCVFGII